MNCVASLKAGGKCHSPLFTLIHIILLLSFTPYLIPLSFFPSLSFLNTSINERDFFRQSLFSFARSDVFLVLVPSTFGPTLHLVFEVRASVVPSLSCLSLPPTPRTSLPRRLINAIFFFAFLIFTATPSLSRNRAEKFLLSSSARVSELISPLQISRHAQLSLQLFFFFHLPRSTLISETSTSRETPQLDRTLLQ